MTICNACGYPKEDHPFRHPFKPMNESTNWDRRFIGLARHIAEWSKDPSTKVGAVLVDAKRRVIGTGYNGFPRGIADDGRLNDRPTKYKYVVHAEINAILNATRADIEECTLYCTHMPCMGCGKQIIQSGVRMVCVPYQGSQVESWADEQRECMEMFQEAGVQVVRVP